MVTIKYMDSISLLFLTCKEWHFRPAFPKSSYIFKVRVIVWVMYPEFTTICLYSYKNEKEVRHFTGWKSPSRSSNRLSYLLHSLFNMLSKVKMWSTNWRRKPLQGSWKVFLYLLRTNSQEMEIFKTEVHVPPGSNIEFELHYQELMQRKLGFYEHSLYLQPGRLVPHFQVRRSPCTCRTQVCVLRSCTQHCSTNVCVCRWTCTSMSQREFPL